MKHVTLLCLSLSIAACTEAGPGDPVVEDDAEVESGGGTELGKADGIDVTGLYAVAADTSPWNGDIPNLELRSGAYVRNRCYGWDCEQKLPETDDYDLVRSSSGRTYLRFWSFEMWWNEDASDREEVPVIADVYEVKRSGSGLSLRKSYSRRWQLLYPVTIDDLCRDTDGIPANSWCQCQDGDLFVAGAGGCIRHVVGTEAGCDDSGGSYTDDDATVIGTYCRCGLGRTMTEDGCVDI